MNWKAPYKWLRKRAGLNDNGIRHNKLSSCLNCGFELIEEDSFCKSCGQKVHISRLTIGMLVSEFFAGLFNLENGFYKSLTRVLYPGFLSRQFIEGKRKSYLNPIRFFVIALIAHLAVINYVINLEDLSSSSTKAIESVGKTKIYDSFLAERDSLIEEGLATAALLDSIEKRIYHGIVSSKADTTLKLSEIGFVDLEKYNFMRSDIYELSIPEILEKYKVINFWERLTVTQFIRMMRDPPGALRFLIGNIIWCVFLTILILSFLLKLLYIRNKRYYVEHFIVLCHIHAFAFITASIALLILDFTSNNQKEWLILTTVFSIVAHFLFSIKNYYAQGWFNTIFKFGIIGIAYIFTISLVAVATALLSLALFK